MADDKWMHKDLPRANGIIAPAVYNTKDEEWQPLKSENGNFPTTDLLAVTALGNIRELIKEQEEKVKKFRPVDGNGDSLFTSDRPGNVQDKNVADKLDDLKEVTEGNKPVDFPDDYPDSAVKSELESMKATQKDMMDAIKKTNETLQEVIKDGSVNTQLNGSNMEDGIPTNKVVKQEFDTLINSKIIESGDNSGVTYLYPNGASEVYVFVQINKEPWSLNYRNQFGSVSAYNGYPELKDVEETYPRSKPAISFPLGYNYQQGIPRPSNIREAKDWGLPITSSEYFRLYNNSSEDALVTVNVLRVWR